MDRKSGGLAILAFLLAGCAAQQWHLNGRTQAHLNHAAQVCDNYAGQWINQGTMNQGGAYMGQGAATNNSTLGIGGALLVFMEGARYKSVYNRCMADHGFTKAN